MASAPPVILTIAGSDCSAGAGVQADLKSIHALGGYGLTAITSVVAEVPGEVRSVHNIPVPRVIEQIEICFEKYPIAAVKTGMLPSAQLVRKVARLLQCKQAQSFFPIVVDPVMIASSGTPLISEEAIQSYRQHLLPLATLATPNLNEAEVLLGSEIASLVALRKAAIGLSQRYGIAFLCKGGHLRGTTAVDILPWDKQIESYEAPFVKNAETHGTGCAYSAAIAARLAAGDSLPHAVARAKRFLSQAIASPYCWQAVHAMALDRDCSQTTP